MRIFKYRLTLSFNRGGRLEQLEIGVNLESSGMQAAIFMRDAPDLQHACLSNESTGEVIWLRRPEQLTHEA